MIQGKVKTKYLSIEEILKQTNGGWDIYNLYLGKIQRQMNRPWGGVEKKKSWGIFPRNGIWFWKDKAREEAGTAIQFVQKFFGLSMSEAKDKICWDFGLGGKEINSNPVKITWEAPTITDKEYVKIQFTDMPFTKRHHDFWNIAEVSEDRCRRYNCFAVKDLAIRRRKVYIKENEIVFAFYCPEEDAVKIYFPERESDKRFRNNVSFHHLWNYSNLHECENLIVQKSPKDMIVTSVTTECVTATQAEAVKIFDNETVRAINDITDNVWIWYGSDDDGVKKCKEITKNNKPWKYINTPKNMLPEVNDVYSFVKSHNLHIPNSGIAELDKFMKSKNLIV